ncbi:MAG: hypothetical protein ABH883_08450, partial [Candidatus Omnitrophota bacterium]
MRKSMIKPDIIAVISALMVYLFTIDISAYDMVKGYSYMSVARRQGLQDKLSTPVRNSGIVSRAVEDKGRIQMALFASIRALPEVGGIGGNADIGELVEKANEKILSEVSNYPGLQLFMYEARSNSVMCRFREENGASRTYHAVIGQGTLPADSPRVDVYDEKEFAEHRVQSPG